LAKRLTKLFGQIAYKIDEKTSIKVSEGCFHAQKCSIVEFKSIIRWQIDELNLNGFYLLMAIVML
jgi:hypothetical protein